MKGYNLNVAKLLALPDKKDFYSVSLKNDRGYSFLSGTGATLEDAIGEFKKNIKKFIEHASELDRLPPPEEKEKEELNDGTGNIFIPLAELE